MKTQLNKVFILIALTMTTVFFNGCAKSPDFEAENQKLLAIHRAQKDAHLNKDVKQFVNLFSNPMISIKRGLITTVTQDAALERFKNYFNSVIIKSWDDIAAPVIDFSEDATMAYMVVDKLVVLTYENEENRTIEETTHFAWVSVFKKQEDGEWKIVCNISTNEPKENE
ncbi:MAG: hypothetical protein CVU00_11440 [Bacteroidetes bacterium HGW-Bacteroidetes-17]|jgi:ketosteroid isomerase-like protein|nr:MAG: hypothetical protein CVU00_11440 [Bacteroidetes bacterium HGW-Bacteroidetes-17]